MVIPTRPAPGDPGAAFLKWTYPDGGTAAPSQNTGWYRQPKQGDKFVLLQDTFDLKWMNETPMAITVEEVLADTNFDTLNRTRVKAMIDEVKRRLEAAAGGPLQFVSVPDLFFGVPDPAIFPTGRTAYAFAPGLANVQIIGGSYYFPRPYAPVDANGKDIFEEVVKSRIDNALFVDDWTTYNTPPPNPIPDGRGYYHTQWGEVHCGSLVKREIWNKDWWNP